MSKDDRIRLQHMLDAAREALTFTQSCTRTDLDKDRMLVLSLVKTRVHGDEGPGDAGRFVRGQKCHGLRHFIKARHAAEGEFVQPAGIFGVDGVEGVPPR